MGWLLLGCDFKKPDQSIDLCTTWTANGVLQWPSCLSRIEDVYRQKTGSPMKIINGDSLLSVDYYLLCTKCR